MLPKLTLLDLSRNAYKRTWQANAVGPREFQACRAHRGQQPGNKGVQACRRSPPTHASVTGSNRTSRKFKTNRKNEENWRKCIVVRVGVNPSRNVSRTLARRANTDSQCFRFACELAKPRLAPHLDASRCYTDSHPFATPCEPGLHRLAQHSSFPSLEPCGTIC